MGSVKMLQLRATDSIMDAVRAFFEPQLLSLDLTVSILQSQSRQELNASLDRINELIAHPDQLGVLKLTATSQGMVIGGTHDAITVGALPLLLERKKFILDRIRLMSAAEQLDDVQDVIDERVEDPEVRRLITEMLGKYQSDQQHLVEESSRSGQAAVEVAMRSLDVRERTWQMRKSLLEREPVAILIGSLLLIIVTIALIVGMFTRIPSPEILGNAFLLILGFFFGQSGSLVRTQQHASDAPATPGAAPATTNPDVDSSRPHSVVHIHDGTHVFNLVDGGPERRDGEADNSADSTGAVLPTPRASAP